MTFQTRYQDLKKTLNLIKKSYPDVSVNGSRIMYSSSKVNALANKLDIYRTCGCCSDVGHLVSPYVKISTTNIYSKPSSFYIGDSDSYGYGIMEREGWEEMRKSNISENII